MKSHYFKSKLVKMGIWSLLPGDIETWHGEHTHYYFKKLFGIGKGILLLNNINEGFSHAYVTADYFKQLFSRIDKINKKDHKALEKKLKTFYILEPKAKKNVASKVKNPKLLSNAQLAKEFFRIRDWIHHLAIYDQFAWIAEEYWNTKMQKILTYKLHLKKASPEYNHAIFSLTKPEKISTTLLEKKAVLEKALKIKRRLLSLSEVARDLAKKFGWMPVFTYGTPWKTDHYMQEIKQVLKKSSAELQEEYYKLKNYKQIRNKVFNSVAKKYKLSGRDLQVFIDFGLAIGVRNEAEYFVSFGGFYLLPLYEEIAKRLYLSVKQVRCLYEKEVIDALLGKADAQKLLEQKGGWGSVGFDKHINKRNNITGKESQKLFDYIESYVKPIQGSDESQGTCASPGMAVGKVRIIPSPEYNYKVEDGDILFTYSTTTDYLPAMKRAAAIITEVGGLTCHAAVVSREFAIPCIVALKNSMKNFKDGQLVEVDANKGIVRKI